MRILVATGALTLPQMVGGSQRTGDTLLRGLKARGHDVAITAALYGKDRLGLRARVLMKLTGRRAISDETLGYRAYRSWETAATAQEVAGHFRPDVVVVQAHKPGLVGRAFHEAGVPLLFSFQDVEFQDHKFDLRRIAPIRGVANSRFTGAAAQERFGAQCTVIHPMIDPERYRVARPGSKVTFVNPDPVKGVDIAIAVAALLPDVPFRLQETWPMGDAERRRLTDRLDGLDNVMLNPQVEDMREVYGDTRILLAPSQWREGYGRIATEAQISGIPVVGSDRGGLPEAIGAGGAILSAESPPSEWADVIRRLWDDEVYWAEKSAAALRHAARPAIQLETQLDAWERAIMAAAAAPPGELHQPPLGGGL